MKNQASHNDYAPIGKLAVSASRGLYASSYGDQSDATRRQKKHEMLLTFMANAKTQKRKPAPVKPRLLTTLLSIFF